MTAEELTEEALFEQGTARLAELLGPSWQIDRRPSGKEKHRSGGDIIVTLHAEGESSYGQLLVDVELAGVSPRMVEEVLLAKLDLLRQLNHYTTLLVLTPWLSRQVQSLLRKHDISYLDLMGNVSLRVPRPAIVIYTEGATRAPQALAKEPSRTTLAGPKAGRLVRVLTDVRPPFRAGELAQASGLSLGYVSRLLDTLEDQLLIRRDGRVITFVDWPNLLRARAAREVLLRKGSFVGLLAPNGIPYVIKRIRHLPQSALANIAVTGTHAAHAVAPLSAGGQLMVYVSPRMDEDDLGDELGLLPVDENADVLLLQARDRSVFERSEIVEGVPHVALSQVALDCLAGPGRMPAEGEAVIEYMKGHEDLWQVSGIHDLLTTPQL
ncbi:MULTISPECIES: helix-turn-helix domain-containing protein [Streptomyces]|uniref:helix-turn-helix domain-containing protein n=1 Tax=Streptomyces TaxID=1883 RepID=UPI001F4D6AB3|nr:MULTISPECIES: helix-turn-helix domain-containing protein [Streptomyces]WSA62325.1 helix-turn-helix domain-containing protein [Streptomyces microflavus]WSS34992.1 helix-turn-helix domain-containing protein [Streptomyces microflavus]WST16440.1 helix-turn-helix domain-containing protein [Streptomyces microflavus]